MGLLNSRNLRKAKQLLDSNRHRLGDVVEKAGTQIDKVSKGKTSNVTAKASDAAKKYSAGGVTHHGMDAPVEDVGRYDSMSSEEAQRRQAEATATAANAVKGAADAITNMMNKAAAQAESANAASSGKDADTGSDDEIPRDEFDRG